MKILLALALLVLGGCANAHPRDVALTLDLERGTCSGTAVGKDLILTASHCLEDGNRIQAINGQEAYGLKVVHDGADHALVRVTMKFKQWAKVSRRAPMTTERVQWVGNPAAQIHVYREGYVARSWPSEIWLDAHGFNGDSGAGVFCGDGQVCGVVSAGKIWTNGPFSFSVLYPLGFSAADWKAIAANATVRDLMLGEVATLRRSTERLRREVGAMLR
jgi:hypothetical protein